MTPLDIRPLDHPSDLENCARFMAASDPWKTIGRDYAACLETLRDDTRERVAAWSGDQIAGFIILNLGGPLIGYIQTVCVAAAFRGSGVGSELVGWAERRIFGVAPNVFLFVSSFNDGARRLYERLGYRVVGEVPDYLVRGASEILMRKTIGPLSEFRARR